MPLLGPHDAAGKLESSALRARLKAFQTPSTARSLWELAVTAIPFMMLWAAVFVSSTHHFWWGFLLSVPAAGLLVRLFMIQHDCGHHAFFNGTQANTWLGRVLGVVTLTPYEYWRRSHAIHHATSGHLGRRDLGAIEICTVDEYRALSSPRKLGYRLYRHPAVMFGLGPSYMFLLQHRLPIGLMDQRWAWGSVMSANLALVLLVLPFWLTGTLGAFLATQLPISVIAGTVGVWLFYVQHQFEDAYWEHEPEWSATDSALKGSSHLVLPAPLNWLSANISVHHVHHLASRIPFYRLPDALSSEPMLREGPRLDIRQAFGSLKLALWDERSAKLIAFSQI